MSNIAVIGKYEMKMQCKRVAGWIVWVLVSAATAWDCWPSTVNYTRLSELEKPSYFIVRILGQSGLLLLFGLMFLVAGRIPKDRTSGTKELFMATPLGRTQYLLGKWAGNFGYMVFMMTSFLLIHVAGYLLLNTAPFFGHDFWLPLSAGMLYIVLPSCFFMATCASLMPVWCDLRLCMFLLSALCVLNMFTFGVELSNPFFQITFGVLSDRVHDNPHMSAPDTSLVVSSFAFLWMTPVILGLPALFKRNFWRDAE